LHFVIACVYGREPFSGVGEQLQVIIAAGWYIAEFFVGWSLVIWKNRVSDWSLLPDSAPVVSDVFDFMVLGNGLRRSYG